MNLQKSETVSILWLEQNFFERTIHVIGPCPVRHPSNKCETSADDVEQLGNFRNGHLARDQMSPKRQ